MDKTNLANIFGGLVQCLRLERGLSQEAFAQACGLERTHMGKIERGEVNVTVATATKLARGLDLSISEFFTELERHLGENE